MGIAILLLVIVIGAIMLLKKKTTKDNVSIENAMGQSRPISYEKMAGYSVITALFDKSGDFDYKGWLNKLCDCKISYTRIFLTLQYCLHCNNSGYRIQPWHEDNVGMHVWDLEKPNELFYKRLRNFVRTAKHKGIITCVSLFDNWAIRSTWDSHPFNQKNNINDVRANRESWEWTSQKMKDVEYKLVEKVMQELKEYSDAVILEIGNENQESQGWHGEIISWINHINTVQGTQFKISLNTIGDNNWQLGNNYYSVHNVDSKKIARKAGSGCIFSTDGLPSGERYNSNHIYKIALETFKRNGHFSQHSTAKDISNMEEASKPNEAILDAIMRAKRNS